jgi:YVTN family beta-propeller protein
MIGLSVTGTILLGYHHDMESSPHPRRRPPFASLAAAIAVLMAASALSLASCGPATSSSVTSSAQVPVSSMQTSAPDSTATSEIPTTTTLGVPTTTAPPQTTTETTLSTDPQTLEVETSPSGAGLTIRLQDGTAVTGESPFSQEIPGGHITIEVSEEGYDTVSRQVTLTGPEAIKIWLDPEGQIYESLVRFSCGKQPKQVLFTPDGTELWVAILGGGKTGLEAYDPITGEQLAAINLGGREGTELTMTGDGKTIFVSQMATSTIWEVDRATRAVVRHFKSGGVYTKILLLSRDEKLLYASNWKSNNVSEIDVATGKVKRVIPVVTTPRGLYITPDSKYLYVSRFGRGQLQKIDLASGKGTVIYKTGGSLRHMVADERKNLLYVGEFEENKIYVVDMTTDAVHELAETDERPNTIELSPDGAVLYVSNRGKDNPKTGYLTKGPEWGSVLAIDTATGKILDAIVGGNQCTGLDVSPDGSLLAFSDFLDRVIRVYRIPDYDTLLAGDGGRAGTHLEDIVKD